MGRHGYYVIDADGHGGEPLDWRERIPSSFRPQMDQYLERMRRHYTGIPGGGQKKGEGGPGAIKPPANDAEGMRRGMYDPKARLEDMDFEGIDVTVMFPPGSGEEWALLDPKFAAVLCRTLNDARAEYASHCPERLKLVAKLPMIDPQAAAAELERCTREHPGLFVGMATAQHIRDKNLHDPSFDAVWETAQRLGLAVCPHGGGQAPDQVPFGIERFKTRLEIHAITHPLGQMLALTGFTLGGVLRRFPRLRIGFMESGVAWLPFWLERLDAHYESMPEQAPAIDRKPSEYFLAGNCFVGCEPDERMLGYVSAHVSPDVICYASDYCHWDCKFPDSVRLIAERGDLDGDAKRRILGANPARLFNLKLPAGA
jgi:hypothetical protein